MKIVAITRALNEEENIYQHCRGYDWADLHLIADGGSTDRTIEIARRFDNVRVRRFNKRKNTPAGFMNPEPAHQNFLIDWAENEGADWIISDDADCWPNTKLHRDARDLFMIASKIGKAGIMLYRLYMWRQEYYFPAINVGQSIWAWRPGDLNARTSEDTDSFFEAVHKAPPEKGCLILAVPYVCLHYWDPEGNEDKYRAWGHPQVPIRESMYWPPEPLPRWAVETVWPEGETNGKEEGIRQKANLQA